MSDFLEKYSVACFIGFGLLLMIGLAIVCIPFYGVDYQVFVYMPGDTNCLLRITEHRLFYDKIHEEIEPVYEIGGNFYVEIDEKFVELGELMK